MTCSAVILPTLKGMLVVSVSRIASIFQAYAVVSNGYYALFLRIFHGAAYT